MTSKRGTGRSTPLQDVAVEKLRNLSAWLRDYVTAIKKGNIHPFTSIERKAREATRNEPWGPTGTMLNVLAEATMHSANTEIIFAVIHLRLGYPPEKWRNVYKALVLLDFLVLRGSDQCVQITSEELMGILENLENFAYSSPEGKDQGINVRHRAKTLKELMLDVSRLSRERQAHVTRRRTYTGFTRDQLASGSLFHDDHDIPSPPSARGDLRRTLSDSSVRESRPSSFAGDIDGGPDDQRLRKAGETKGVSMEDNKRQLAELKALMEQPQNRECADCRGGGAAGRASWASINNGVFLCMRCAGIHRGLGVHISKVRSCTLDTWLPQQVAFMAQTGNELANRHLEATLDPARKPLYASSDLHSFITEKYAEKAFIGGEWPPAPASVRSGVASPDLPVNAGPDSNGVAEIPAHEYEAAIQNITSTLAAKKSLPRLNSKKRTASGMSVASGKPLTFLVSVPLPGTVPPPAAESLSRPEIVLDSHSGHQPSLLPASLSQLPPAASELQCLAVPISLLDDDAGFNAPITAGFGDPPLFTSLSLETLDAVADPGAIPASHQTPSREEPMQVLFEEESIKDWGQPALQPPPLAAPPPLHIHSRSVEGDSEASVASTPFLTPSIARLLGPGPGVHMRLNGQRPAPMRYNPPDLSFNPGHAESALLTATKQWTLNSQQLGNGLLDELVLHAIAELPSTRHHNFQDAVQSAQAPPPPSMLQQRNSRLQQTTV